MSSVAPLCNGMGWTRGWNVEDARAAASGADIPYLLIPSRIPELVEKSVAPPKFIRPHGKTGFVGRGLLGVAEYMDGNMAAIWSDATPMMKRLV